MPLRSLYLKVSLPLIAAVVVMTASLVLVGSLYKQRLVRHLVQERADGISAIARSEIAHLMRERHATELPGLLHELGDRPGIAAVRILAPDGRVLVSAHSGDVGHPLAAHLADATFGPALVHAAYPIDNRTECRACHGRDGPVIGVLDLDFDVADAVATLNAWWAVGTLVGAAQLFAVVALVGALLAFLVVRPIGQVLEGMDRVRRGDLETTVPAASSLEIDDLVSGFNAMTARLREAARIEEEAHRLRVERAEQLAAVGQMAANLAHEIRNPLSGVKAAIEVIARQLSSRDPRAAILQRSASELDRIERVIRDLLSYARPRPPSLQTVDLNEIVADALGLLGGQADVQGIAIAWQPAAELPRVLADPAMIRQIVVNLVMNAFHAVAQTPAARVFVTTESRDHAVVCRVRDTGAGVPAAEAPQIFSAFFTTKSRGTGLGLAISRRLVEVHLGQLVLENPGQPGASFAFTLPVAGAESRSPLS